MPLGQITRSDSLESLKDGNARSRDEPMPNNGKLTGLAVADSPRSFVGLVDECAPNFFSHPAVLESPQFWRVIKARAISNDPGESTRRIVDKYGFWKNGKQTNFESDPILCRHLCMMDLAFRLLHGQQGNSNGAREAFFRNIKALVEADPRSYQELNTLAIEINKQSQTFDWVSNATFANWVQDKFKHMVPNKDGSLVDHFYCIAIKAPVSHAMNIQLKIKLDKLTGNPVYHVSVYDPNNAGISRKFKVKGEDVSEVDRLEMTQFTSSGAHYLDDKKSAFRYLMHPITGAKFSSKPGALTDIYLYDVDNVLKATTPRDTVADYEFDHDY